MKMKKCSALIVIVALMSLMLVACGGSDSIVGTWEASQEGTTSTFTFNEDLSGSTSLASEGVDKVEGSFTYKLDGDKLKITGEGGETEYIYALDGKKLTLTIPDGASMVYEKK